MNAGTVHAVESVTPTPTRRAWLTVLVCLGIFAAAVAALGLGLNWTYEHATSQRGAEASVISGTGALWRSSPDNEWTIFNGSIQIDEGDEISTELGTVVWITLFDGSTLEVTERSQIRFDRLRESRFSDAIRQARIELHHGSIYATMAPVAGSNYGELEVESGDMSVFASDTDDDQSSVSPSFVVEARDEEVAGIAPFRAAAFRGTIAVETATETVELFGPEQYMVDADGAGHISAAIRSEVLVNGSFADGITGWEQIYSAEGREPRERVGTVESILRENVTPGTALHIHRRESSIWALTGVRQTIERTLRLPAALTLEFDVLVESQGNAVAGRETVPLAIELDYTDILGQERVWTTVYSIRAADGVLDADAFTTVIPGRWTHVIVDLNNLEPIPKVLDTIVVYASGGGYDSFVSNLSLTTGEGNSAP